jgi:methyl-accepting chemotaxis protein
MVTSNSEQSSLANTLASESLNLAKKGEQDIKSLLKKMNELSDRVKKI